MLGLRPDEVLAILQRGERVLSRAETRAWDRGRPVQITITTPDIENFRRARTQIAADIARAVSAFRPMAAAWPAFRVVRSAAWSHAASRLCRMCL